MSDEKWCQPEKTNGEYTFIVSTNKERSVSDSHDKNSLQHYGGYLVAESIKKGETARLIESAPDMFVALKKLIDIEGCQPGNCEWANEVISILNYVNYGWSKK